MNRDQYDPLILHALLNIITFCADREDPGAIETMKNNYKANVTYQDVAREFTAELFNAAEWALLFKKSGAR